MYSTTNTYAMKRDIIGFSEKLSAGIYRPDCKFTADMLYGLLASGSCLLTDIADQLHEKGQKINIVDRLSRHLADGLSPTIVRNYLRLIRQMTPSEPIVHIDDSDVIKPDAYHFEALGYVRDGSASTKNKNVYAKGYHVTEACTLNAANHPMSIFSEVHSSAEKGFTSINTVTFDAIGRAVALLGKATFVMDRGYDDNKIFNRLFDCGQDFIIRLTTKRKVFYHNKWIPVTELCKRRKGKMKLSLFYRGENHDAYLSHIKVRITAAQKDIHLVLVYGITEHPMMLATNKPIQSKKDVVAVAKAYFSRWRIEEYFRAKKQLFQFESFRVRKLKAINALNFYITAAMTFLARVSEKSETNYLKVAIIRHANPIKTQVHFLYYRLAKGIVSILSYAREGVRPWFKTSRPRYKQLTLKLIC